MLKRAAVATERALMATYATIKPGDVESDLVARLGSEILRGGAELPAFLYLTTGPNTGPRPIPIPQTIAFSPATW